MEGISNYDSSDCSRKSKGSAKVSSNTDNQCKEIFTANVKRLSNKISKHQVYSGESLSEWNLITTGNETLKENTDQEYSIDLLQIDHTEYNEKITRKEMWLYLVRGTDELESD